MNDKQSISNFSQQWASQTTIDLPHERQQRLTCAAETHITNTHKSFSKLGSRPLLSSLAEGESQEPIERTQRRKNVNAAELDEDMD